MELKSSANASVITQPSRTSKSGGKYKAIESRKHAGKNYVFQSKLGSGTQATVWKFSLDGNIFAGKVTSNDWIFEERASD